MVARRQYAFITLVDSTLTPTPNSNEDISIADIYNDIGALDFPSNIEDTREIEIGGPSRIGDSLATLSSDELSDPPITQVAKNETNSESDDDDDKDKVILSTYPPSV